MKKQTKTTLLAFAGIFSIPFLALSGCGGGGGDTATTEPMVTNQTYEIRSGQVITKTTPTAELEVVVNLQTGATQAAILSGGAEITTP